MSLSSCKEVMPYSGEDWSGGEAIRDYKTRLTAAVDQQSQSPGIAEIHERFQVAITYAIYWELKSPVKS